MRQRTDNEQTKANMLKAARTAIRLKHSLAADEELNEMLPEIEDRIDRALASGTEISFDVLEMRS